MVRVCFWRATSPVFFISLKAPRAPITKTLPSPANPALSSCSSNFGGWSCAGSGRCFASSRPPGPNDSCQLGRLQIWPQSNPFLSLSIPSTKSFMTFQIIPPMTKYLDGSTKEGDCLRDQSKIQRQCSWYANSSQLSFPSNLQLSWM